jgi:hypothetical protein
MMVASELGPVIAVMLIIAAFVVLLWPLVAIIRSRKVAGAKKLLWIFLWWVGVSIGPFVGSLIRSSARTYPVWFTVVGPLSSLLLAWVVYFWFRFRTQNLQEAPGHNFGYKVGLLIGKYLRKWRPRSD